jgi:hypothetical protein
MLYVVSRLGLAKQKNSNILAIKVNSMNLYYFFRRSNFVKYLALVSIGVIILLANISYVNRFFNPTARQSTANFSSTTILNGDQVINSKVSWTGLVKVRGNIIIVPGGQLDINDATLELDGDYAAQYSFFNLGGIVNSSDSTLGGTLKNNNIVQTNFYFYSGQFNTVNTQIRYTWG